METIYRKPPSNTTKNDRPAQKKSQSRVKARSQYPRAQLKEKADSIRQAPDCPDIVRRLDTNGEVLTWHGLYCKSLKEKCDTFFISNGEIARRAGLSQRYTQTCIKKLVEAGITKVEQVKQKWHNGRQSWMNDRRGNRVTLLAEKDKNPNKKKDLAPPGAYRASLSPSDLNKKIFVDASINPEPIFNKKKELELSPELEFELNTLPQIIPFGKIKEKTSALLDLPTQPGGGRNLRLKALVAKIVETATVAQTLNKLLVQGIRKDKEDMMTGQIPRAIMGILSVFAKLKTSTGGIKNPAAYLIGYLRKPRDQQRGYQSLAAIVKSMPSAPIVDDKIRQAIEPATMHDGVFVRGRELLKQIEPWRPMPESKQELVRRFDVSFSEIMGDCHPLAKKDMTDRHGHWAIPIVLSVRLSNLLRKKSGRAPIRSELAYVKTLSKKDRIDNPQAYVDAVLAKAGVDLIATGIKTRPTAARDLKTRAVGPVMPGPAMPGAPTALKDIFDAVANHQPLDVAEMRKVSAKIKKKEARPDEFSISIERES